MYRLLSATLSEEHPNATDMERIEGEIIKAMAARKLTPKGMGVVWSWREPYSLERPLWELAVAIEGFLVLQWDHR